MREVLHPRLSIPFVEAEIRLTSRFLREWTDRYASDGCSIFILDIALYTVSYILHTRVRYETNFQILKIYIYYYNLFLMYKKNGT